MTQYNAVIFDFGGVLLDWNPYYLLRQIMTNDTEIAALLQEIDFKAWNHECDSGRLISEAIEDLCVQYPHRAEVLHAFNDRWMETLGRVYEKNVEILRSLAAQGVPLYGLSNWSADMFAKVEQEYDFFSVFKDMAISGREKTAKPEPKLAHILLKRNHLNPAECIYIDDSEDNIRMGRQVGMECIQYASSAQLREELIKRGFSV
jgi:2-haloacid dehalogenase